MAHSPLAVAADYADAILVSRRAKNWIFALLLLAIVFQIAVFLAARFSDVLPAEAAAASGTATPQPAALEKPPVARQLMEYVVNVTAFAGVVLSVLLVLVLVIVVNIMLVARLVGLGKTVSALMWSLVLLAILFPWQAFIARTVPGPTDLRIPGALYTWGNLVALAHFSTDGWANAILKWSRFVAFPIVTIILLVRIHLLSRLGIRYAIGEAATPGAEEPAAARPK